ncbi:glycosyltransferase family 2 protein [Planococcus sp. YIM B11945]|uniref:glycosyltransferase family 2 protein n=1 Tax=Planococcus sp. YIM B11945 TaxID=3435410 RepID=UPI003D7DCC47
MCLANCSSKESLMAKITVAIPVYNDGQFIERCIDSILTQSLSQELIEIICIDDGSTDDSAQILDDYALKYPNVKVEHQANSGSPAGPRNKAISMASGKYIYFVDADDFLGKQALEKMREVAEKHNCDVVIGKYKGVNRGAPTGVFRRNPEVFQFFGSNAMYSISATKMFKMELLRKENIRFSEATNIGEDHGFTASAYIHSNAIGLVKDYDCYYQTRYVEGNRTQLTSQQPNFDKIAFFIEETLRTIASLNLEEEKIQKGLFHYWDRLLNFEIPNVLSKFLTPADRQKISRKFSEIAHTYSAEESFSLFPPNQRIKFRLLEKGRIEDLADFLQAEKVQTGLRVYKGELYPAPQSAFEVALEEGVNLTNVNKLLPFVLNSYFRNNTLMLEGYLYHSRFYDPNQSLLLRVINRETKDNYLVKVQEGLLPENRSQPLLKIPAAREKYSYFHVSVSFPTIVNFETVHRFDFNVIAEASGYITEERLRVDESHFHESVFLAHHLFTESYTEAKPYKTTMGNFSLELGKPVDLNKAFKFKEAFMAVEALDLKCFFKLKTNYFLHLEEADHSFLFVENAVFSASQTIVVKRPDAYVVYCDFPIAKSDKKMLARAEQVRLLINGFEFAIPNLLKKQ